MIPDQRVVPDEWDHVEDFLPVYRRAISEECPLNKEWQWYLNARCKYVELRVDMRTGHCIIKDRDGKRITPEQLAYQYKEGDDPAASPSRQSEEGP